MSIVHVVGTGTIGEPLIGLLLRHKKDFGIDEVTFHKNTPLQHDVARVNQLIKAGGILCTDTDKFAGFYNLKLQPVYNRDEAIDRADVIIDCTPVGNKNKQLYYDRLERIRRGKLFIAQGSEEGFGTPFASGINESALKDEEFIQVVSCNTHNISVLLKTLSDLGTILGSDFVCMRRASDTSQDEDMCPSIEISKPKYTIGNLFPDYQMVYGTHHAYDVARLFRTLKIEVPVYSSAVKMNSQYMHCIRFRVDVDKDTQKLDVLNILRANPRIATTYFSTANRVFSFGRDYGHYGRILNQAVVNIPSLDVYPVVYPLNTQKRFTRVTGFCFTPQDGNSLISSIAATLWHLHGRDWNKVDNYLKVLDPYIFKEI